MSFHTFLILAVPFIACHLLGLVASIWLVNRKQILMTEFVSRLPRIGAMFALALSLSTPLFALQGSDPSLITDEWPGTAVFLQQALFLAVVDDTWFYWSHRAVHANRWLYTNVHKKHHEVKAPSPLDFLYVTPMDMLLTGGVGYLCGFTCIIFIWGALSIPVVATASAFRILHELYIHSEKEVPLLEAIPFLAGSEAHSHHHAHNNCSFASTFVWWDLIMGTVTPPKKRFARARLSDGKVVACIVPNEAICLDSHVSGYLEHGIQVDNTAIVLDVGANIGLFGMRLAERFPNIQVLAFEPIPEIYHVCAENLNRFPNATALCVGLSSKAEQRTFAYFPRCPALSTGHMEDWDSQIGAFTEAVRGNLQAAGKLIPLARIIPSFASPLVASWLQSSRQSVDVHLKTVSDIIREQELPRIDLLKIDCEGAELEVLMGIEENHWPCIRQVVAEVNNVDDRLECFKALLKENGFDKIIIDVEDGFEKTSLRNVFAIKSNNRPTINGGTK